MLRTGSGNQPGRCRVIGDLLKVVSVLALCSAGFPKPQLFVLHSDSGAWKGGG